MTTLTAIEQEIQTLDYKKALLLAQIKDEKLYLEAGYTTFEHYILDRHDMSPSTFAQHWQSAKAARELQDYGVNLKNEYAAREYRSLRALVAKHLISHDEFMDQLIYAIRYAATGDIVQAKHIKSVLESLREVLATGLVSVSGEQLAFGASIWEQVTESLARQRQYAIDGVKRQGWCKPVVFAWNGSLPSFDDIPDGAEVRISWRVQADE